MSLPHWKSVRVEIRAAVGEDRYDLGRWKDSWRREDGLILVPDLQDRWAILPVGKRTYPDDLVLLSIGPLTEVLTHDVTNIQNLADIQHPWTPPTPPPPPERQTNRMALLFDEDD